MKRGQSSAMVIAVLLLAVISAGAIIARHSTTGAVGAIYADRVQGSISDKENNEIGYGPLMAIDQDGDVVGNGWTSSRTYTLDLKEGWDDHHFLTFELGNRREDFTRCAQVRVDDLLAHKTRSVIIIDIKCNILCERRPDVFYCEPGDNTGSIMLERSR